MYLAENWTFDSLEGLLVQPKVSKTFFGYQNVTINFHEVKHNETTTAIAVVPLCKSGVMAWLFIYLTIIVTIVVTMDGSHLSLKVTVPFIIYYFKPSNI